MSKFDSIISKISEGMPMASTQQPTPNQNQPVSSQQTNPNQPGNNVVKTSTGQDPAKIAQNTGFSLTNPNTAKAMQTLADTKTMADVTKALSDPSVQNVLQGFLKAYTKA